MDTSKINGVADTRIADAYIDYFSERGLECEAGFFDTTWSGKQIVKEINRNRPCHLVLHNHNRYGDHSVLAVGYIQYKYGSSYSTYIKIADGWTDHATRYVWGDCDGYWKYVAVAPK